ncbi:hypothetical protein OH76DRAFT_1418794 [Lentinus brumalis]|uniref:Uncharacterized protein n=1 Tax=Lentinus brumalis TaxID=2498619 RepID=A0A371D8E4_9APHY|nr:hypothetical protein OH76DRAFT_1418794 [Polyporus brumalis]
MPKVKKQKQTRSQASPLRRRPNTRSQTQADAAIASRVPSTEAIPAAEPSVAEPAPSTPTPTTAASSTAPDPPAAQETEPAWASRVWVGTTIILSGDCPVQISMTRALALYRLKKEDLDGLPSTMSNHEVNGFFVPMRLYKERDVERRAWDKYGGPEGFLAQ